MKRKNEPNRETNEYVSLGDVAHKFGVTKRTVARWRKVDPEFPDPLSDKSHPRWPHWVIQDYVTRRYERQLTAPPGRGGRKRFGLEEEE